jgi:hypothetical protein
VKHAVAALRTALDEQIGDIRGSLGAPECSVSGLLS